jgi:hypothetical protein
MKEERLKKNIEKTIPIFIFYTGDGILTIFPFAPDHQMFN